MIISASRRTDIPAFYSKWFYNRIRDGFVLVRNPMNRHQVSKISLNRNVVDCIVFWTKDVAPMLDGLDIINQYNYYFQYTLNAYGERVEINLPSLVKRIESFKKLVDKIGYGKVVWRYDPIFLMNGIDVDYHIEKFSYIAKRLGDYTSRVVISILDRYKKIQNNLIKLEVRDFKGGELDRLLEGISSIAYNNGIEIKSCAEGSLVNRYGITSGKCIDDDLIYKLFGIRLSVGKDRNQRESCGCVSSIDIGEYNSCLYNCKYCYANYSDDIVRRNCLNHDANSPYLIGRNETSDNVSVRKMKSLIIDWGLW